MKRNIIRLLALILLCVMCIPAALADEPLYRSYADSYAARLLITPQAFFDAATWHNGHLGGMADELEVTHHLLLRWIADNGRTP